MLVTVTEPTLEEQAVRSRHRVKTYGEVFTPQPAQAAETALDALKLLVDYTTNNPDDKMVDLMIDKAFLSLLQAAATLGIRRQVFEIVQPLVASLESRRADRDDEEDGAAS